jgi:glutamate formiminotransferase/glutamate formiminotransferase/formiminotetrahydrofolate cyclodeaminase
MLFELVPNVSEGVAPGRVDAIAGAFAAGPDVWLLDVHRDEAHHRSVFTAVARADAVSSAAARLVQRSVDLIDLRRHRGVHPRIGALDVLPIVPLGGASMEDAVLMARRVGEETARRFEIPVFLYGEAAVRSENRDLARLRRGGFEALGPRMASSELVPDFGGSRPHGTAGAVAIGARSILIAFNVELQTTDRAIASGIARRIRASGGGLPHVKALGFLLQDRKRTQVSMNLTDFRVTSMEAAFGAVAAEAERMGVSIARSEIVGLVPEAAVFHGIEDRLKLDRPPGVLEHRMRDAGLKAEPTLRK